MNRARTWLRQRLPHPAAREIALLIVVKLALLFLLLRIAASMSPEVPSTLPLGAPLAPHTQSGDADDRS